MNFYEELGLPRSASSEEIRQAYLNMVRLLHPDQQQDEALRRLADCQMKRLNQMNFVLSDPDRRRRYDFELNSEPAERHIPIIITAPAHPLPDRPPYVGTLVWLATAAIGIVGISWYLMLDSPRRLPSYQPLAAATEAKEQPAEPERVPAARVSLQVKKEESGKPERPAEVTELRSRLEALKLERDRALQQVAKQNGDLQALSRRYAEEQENNRLRESALARIPPPPHIETTALPAKTEEQSRGQFAGTWFYARPKLTIPTKTLYPPEYIETVILEDDGGIRGRYRARYQVADKAISPDVAFYFEGKPKAGTGKFKWVASGGAKGEVQLRLVSENALEVAWSATELGRSLGLSAGTAVLIRRSEQ